MNNFDDMLNVPVYQDEKTAAFVAQSKENRTRCYEMADQTVMEIAGDGGSFQIYLDVQSRFDRYSVNNALLIMAQNPEATKLGDYGHWREQGVYVQRAEKQNPILILEPGKEYTREDGSTGQYYNAKKIYDIAQTTTKDKNQPSVTHDEKLVIRALIHNAPIALRTLEPEDMPAEVGALLDTANNCIDIRKGMSAEDIFRSVSVELAHAEFAGNNPDYDRNENSLKAYCASYMLCKKNGIDTGGYSFDRVADAFEGMEAQEIKGELSDIRDAAGAISSRMAKVLEQGNNTRQPSHER